MDNRWAIGIDLGGTKIDGALVRSDGSLLYRHRQATKIAEGSEAIIQQVIVCIAEILQQAPMPIKGIGIGIAGQIDSVAQLVRFAPNLKWRDIPLIERISRIFPYPIYMDNDVRAAARGEKMFGAGRTCANFICLYLGTGIGGGIVVNNTILTGASCTAGEFGHITVELNGPLCTCGNRGCLEAFSSGWAIAQRGCEALAHQPPDSPLFKLSQGKRKNITAALVFQAATLQDPAAVQIVQKASQALVAGTVSIVNAWNPQRLIIGGGLLKGYPAFLLEITKGVQRQALSAACSSLEVIASGCQENASLLGAAILAFESGLDKKC